MKDIVIVHFWHSHAASTLVKNQLRQSVNKLLTPIMLQRNGITVNNEDLMHVTTIPYNNTRSDKSQTQRPQSSAFHFLKDLVFILLTTPSELPLANTHTYPRLTWRKSNTHGEKLALQRKMNNL